MSNGLGLGIKLLGFGVVLSVLVWALTRWFQHFQVSLESAIRVEPPSPEEASSHTDAVLIIRPGGRLEYINNVAREWFSLSENEQPNLERLARWVRPSSDFLQLCMKEGQARFSISGRLVEGISYQVPGPTPAILLSLRQPDISTELEEGGISSSLLRIVMEFGQSVSLSPELKTTLRVILENVEKLIPADLLEIKIWDEEESRGVPYRFVESPGGERRIERSETTWFGGYCEEVASKLEPILISDTRLLAESETPSERKPTLIRSYLGIPLVVGNKLVGTLEVGQATPNAYSEEDLNILRLISGQAAIAIRNAILYERQQRRAAELSGLAKLARASGSLQKPEDFFRRLIEDIIPLFDVEILGFLLYDEVRHVLSAQNPFEGVPEHIVQVYFAEIPMDSEAEKIIESRKPIVTEDAAQDASWHTLGLQNMAQAASFRDSALIPLVSSNHFLGYMQASNHRREEKTFSQEELRLLEVVANQAAAIINNAALVQQTRQRARRAEALHRIASLIASTASLDEVLRFSLRELAQLLQADTAVVYLLDEKQGALVAHLESVYGVSEETKKAFSRLFFTDPQYRYTVTQRKQPFLSGNLQEDKRVLDFYRPLIEKTRMTSSIVVPLVARERGLGELLISSKERDFFNRYDLQTVMTVAGQLAIALEEHSLSAQTDETLRTKVEQFVTLARVNRELNAALDLNRALQVIHEESTRLVSADCGSILIFEEDSSPEDPLISTVIGCAHDTTLSSLEKNVIKEKQPVIIEDFEKEETPPSHEGIRSAVLVPIAYRGKTTGLIHLHAKEAKRFRKTDVEALELLAVQAAIALGNARRYNEALQQSRALQRRAETLSSLLETTYILDPDQPLDKALDAIARGIQEATQFEVVLISVYEEESNSLRRVSSVGIPSDALKELKAQKQPYASVRTLLKPQFRIRRAYFIPAEETPVVSPELHTMTILKDTHANGENRWNPKDFLLFPLEDSAGNPLGLISLDKPRDGMRPDNATIESVEVFAAQASLLISNYYRLSKFRSQIEALSSGLERQQRLLSVSQNDLPILLHKDLEQTITIQNLERRAQRVRAGLSITESVSRQLDANSALHALGSEILTHLGMSVALIAENTPEGPHLLHVLGNVPRATNPEALFGQRNPLRACLQTGESILVMNTDEDDEWSETPLLNALHAKSFFCLPIQVENKTVAGILAATPEPMSLLTEEDRQVYFQIARQASVILQNIDLLNQTRQRLGEVNLLLDFSRRLRGLGPDGILKALLESALHAIKTAHAGVVLLWNDSSKRLEPKAALRYADNQSMLSISYLSGEALPGRVFAERKPRRVDEVNFTRDYTLSAENLLRYRRATGGRLPVSSLVVPIETADRCLGVLLLDNFNTPAVFKEEDQALLSSLSQQVALSLENVRLVKATEERARQLQAFTNIAATITSSLQSHELISSLLDQLGEVIPYDTATLWLHEDDHLTVAAARGFPDNEERIGLQVAVEDSALFNEMIRTQEVISVNDVREDARFPSLAEPERLSWMGIPLVSKGKVIGAIALEKQEPNFFTLAHAQIARTFAGQATVSLENARLYEDSLERAAELDQRSQRLALLNRFSAALSRFMNADEILWLTSDELLKALNASQVSIVVFEHGRAFLKNVLPETKRVLEKDLPRPLPDAPLFERANASPGVFTTDNIRAEEELKPLASFLKDTQALMALPLHSGETLHALLFIHMDEAFHFSPNEIDLALTIANQAAIALDNTRLYQSTLSTAKRLEIINQVSAEISALLDPEEIYAAIYEATKRLMPVESFVISLLNEEENIIEGVYLIDKEERLPMMKIPLDQGLSGKVIASGKPLLIHGSKKAEQEGGITSGNLETPKSIVAVPLLVGEKAMGMLSAQSFQENVYTEDDVQVLGTLANQAIIAIQNGRLFRETQRLAEELEQRVIERTEQLRREQQNTKMLLDILTEVSSTLDLDRALNRTLSLLNEAIGAEQGTIMLLHPEDNLLHYRAGYGYLTEFSTEERQEFTLKVGEGLAGWVVQNRDALLIQDLYKDPRWIRLSSRIQKHRSAIAAPLIVAEDVIGVLLVFHRQKGFFSPEHLSLVKAIASQVAVAINNANLYELIRDQAERLGSMLRREQEDASRSQAILESVADGVMVTDSEHRISFVNASAQRILHLAPEKVIGQTLEDFAGFFGKASADWISTIHTWAEAPSSYQIGDTFAEQIELEDNRVVLVHLAPVILQGDFLGTVSIFRDITHEVEVDRLKSEFVATVSHELRTPMTSIQGYVDILLMGAAGALNENQRHFLEVVQNNTKRLNDLVDDLLDISRIEDGRIALSPQPVDLQETAEDVVAEILRRSNEEKKPMTISLDVAPDIPKILGDPGRVRQILANLVENAYRYTPEHGQISIRIHCENSSKEVQVDVEDNGVGIPPQDQDRIFERFYRGENPLVLATAGTGLGLPIVRQLVEMHNGRIWMKSTGIPGEGSTFSFTLPVYQEDGE